MATTITAGNATNGAAISSDNTGILELKSGTGSGTTAMTVSTGQNVTFAQAANLPNTFGFKNRIINGAMVIDQRNAGASVTPANGAYTLDRFWYNATQTSRATIQQSTVAPTGFTNSLLVTSSSAYSITSGDVFGVVQRIEGFNTADLGFGTASASTVTVSFWVRSSLTGAFGGSLYNSAANRCYPFSYTINSANTWEQKTVTIAGDTTGTWLTDNGIGITVYFCLGTGSTYGGTANAWIGSTKLGVTGQTSLVGTNGATFYITGVQLEKGSTATSFDYRPYGTELQLCQRYYFKITSQTGGDPFGSSFNISTTQALVHVPFQVPMRTNPSALEQSGTAGHYRIAYLATVATCSSVPTFNRASQFGSASIFTVASGLTAGQGSQGQSETTSAYLAWSAEL
jgi:hypothetical protein